MKRREFIKKSALTAISAGIVGHEAFAHVNNQECLTKNYSNDGFIDSSQHFEFIMTICANGFLNSNATIEEKIVILKIRYKQYINGAFGNILNHESLHTVKSIAKHSTIADAQSVVLSLSKIEKDEFTMSRILDISNIKLVYYTGTNGDMRVRLLNREGIDLIDLEEDKQDIEEECFLTTACVNYFNKEDNCEELTILRKFRDEQLASTEDGKKLILEYYDIAPQIVRNINATDDKHIIYTDIYSKMILPTIRSIENNKFDQAIGIYKNYTYTLKAKFLKGL